MRYRRFEPLDRNLSVLVLGTAFLTEDDPGPAFELLDAWLETGGNAVDTAREYGHPHWGKSERVIGRWLAERGVRERVIVVTKGAHHTEGRRRVTPADVTLDLMQSLEALGVEAVDVYLLHRDDPSRPVGPIVEALNDHLRAGRVRSIGASNWTPARLAEANRYAAEHGLEGFCCSSPNLSLAVQSEPPWRDCVSAHDPESLAFYERTQMPIFSWSAQAGGFFAARLDPDVERVYGSNANRQRLRRAGELGRRGGWTANQVALAWVVNQPFPTFAIIGPATPAELGESVAALDVHLTPADVRWLDLEEDE